MLQLACNGLRLAFGAIFSSKYSLLWWDWAQGILLFTTVTYPMSLRSNPYNSAAFHHPAVSLFRESESRALPETRAFFLALPMLIINFDERICDCFLAQISF
jgi:hypothetical protein